MKKGKFYKNIYNGLIAECIEDKNNVYKMKIIDKSVCAEYAVGDIIIIENILRWQPLLITQKSESKDKGTMRNINNYRMKFWCEFFMYYKNQNASRESAGYNADLCLEEFDKRFNQ